MNATRSLVLAAAAALLALPALSSCGTSFGAQTDKVYTPSDGVNNRHGMVDVLDALVVSDSPGSGRLIAGLSNNDTSKHDELTQVSGASQSQGVQFQLPSPTRIPAGGFVQLADGPLVAASGNPKVLMAGGFVRVTFTFQNADTVTVDVPIVPPGENYSQLQLPGSSSSASPSSSASSSGSASPSASASSTASPAASPSSSGSSGQ